MEITRQTLINHAKAGIERAQISIALLVEVVGYGRAQNILDDMTRIQCSLDEIRFDINAEAPERFGI
ncbi:MAG: hypothetical protein WC114_05950 [Smithellaceae bacterium]